MVYVLILTSPVTNRRNIVAYAINEVVTQMGKIAIEGNIIPNGWFAHLKNKNGKIQINATIILADIVYWYRPIPIYDIAKGELIRFGKKFKDDLLQVNYRYFSNKFGLSEVQIRNALVFLEEKSLIFRSFRNIVIDGHVLNNVMYIGICAEKIAEITEQSDNLPITMNSVAITPHVNNSEIQDKTAPLSKYKEKDWSAKFTSEQKTFLNYLLNIKPEIGDPIEKNHATWWIKHFGVEKIKIAIQVYWQRVAIARQDSSSPMPQHMGKYIRKALNDALVPALAPVVKEESTIKPLQHYSQKSNQGAMKIEPGPIENATTNTQISMTSLLVNEVNDSTSVTFQKNENQTHSQKNKTGGLNSLRDERSKSPLLEP